MIKHTRIIHSVRPFILLAIMLLGSIPTTVSAVSNSFMLDNDINYFGSGGQACSTVGASYSTPLDIPSLKGNDNAEKIWNFLKEQGLSDEQAAGVMGNIQQESGFDPGAAEVVPSHAGQGYGIMQWTGPRRTALEDFAGLKGIPASDLGVQIAFLLTEIETETVGNFSTREGRHKPQFGSPTDNLWETLKKQTAILDATILFHDGFLRSADTTEQIEQKRGGYASAIYEELSGKSVSGSVTGGASGTNCSAAGSGDLIATLLEYAWPEYHPPPYPTPKPAYAEVATKLQNEGKWVGGGNIPGFPQAGYPAIDCGGFVSILLTQSGFEPDYNFGLDGDRGASNQEYGQLPWAKKYWTFLGNGGEINVSDLRPGDVAYSLGHTFVFVGQVDGFESQYASASYSRIGTGSFRAPMAAGEWSGGGETATNPEYVWYGRREGPPEQYGTTNMYDEWGGDR